jgi:SAM-dependent methyltransferase
MRICEGGACYSPSVPVQEVHAQPRPAAATSFDTLVGQLKAVAEPTRLRLLALLSESQLAVTEIAQILGQSQPTVSRQLKLLCDAGLLERSPEGSWVFYRVPDDGPGAALARELVDELSPSDPIIAADGAALDGIRRARTEAAARYFSANAAQWQKLRSLHVSPSAVEQAMVELVQDEPIGQLLDIGTGTGRILEVLAPLVDRGVGLDISHEMLSIARANLSRADLPRCSVRHGNLYQPPFAPHSFDLVVMHQVLHYLDDPATALDRAARMLRSGGRLLIADFAPHGLEHLRAEHEHRRLGIDGDEMVQWATRARLAVEHERTLSPPEDRSESLTVRLWLLRNGPGLRARRLEVVA